MSGGHISGSETIDGRKEIEGQVSDFPMKIGSSHMGYRSCSRQSTDDY